MANLTTIARPYAKAILELAQQSGSYSNWSNMLQFLAIVVKDKNANKLLRNQTIMPQAKAQFINSISPELLNVQGQNLVKLLADNKRLLIVPALYHLFEKMRKQAEHEINLQVILAKEVDMAELERLRSDFAALISGTVILQQTQDASLIGGGKLQIGDRVLESSIQGSLQQLYKHLTHEQVAEYDNANFIESVGDNGPNKRPYRKL